MKTNPFFTEMKPIKKGDKVTIKPEFMDPGDENYTRYAFEDQLEGMNDIKIYATRNSDGLRAPGIQSIRFEMLVMEPRETVKTTLQAPPQDTIEQASAIAGKIIGGGIIQEQDGKFLVFAVDPTPAKTTYATLAEVKAAVVAGAVVHYATPSYTVKQSKFDPEDFNVICDNGHCAYLGKDYKPEDFYSVNSLDAARAKMTPAEITLDDQLSSLERDLTGLPNDDPRRTPLEKEFRRVKREINAKANYNRAVMSCYNHLALGEVQATLTACEQFVGKAFELPIGGAATEAAFDAMRKFGMSVEDIQAAIK